MQDWLQQLPNAQPKHTSILFYKLLPELNRLELPPSQRLELLKLLRPYVHQTIDGLANEYLKQPLHLDEGQSKVAAIAQALQRHSCEGYLLVIQQLTKQKSLNANALKLLHEVTYYALRGLGELYYRCCQLYVPRPPLLWKKVHRLYQLAVEYDFVSAPINEDVYEGLTRSSVGQAYAHTVILACSNTNQLRQVDIFYTHMALLHWSKHLHLVPAFKDNTAVYWINPDSDEGPFYKERHKGTPSSQLLALHFDKLTELLDDPNQASAKESILHIPKHIQQSLIAHLTHCWLQSRERMHPRQETSLQLQVCIGLKACHQELLHGESFEQFLGSINAKPGLDLGIGALSPAENVYYEQEPAHDLLMVLATDASEEGYCLRWEHGVPPQVKTGEILLLKPYGSQYWQTGMIRWTQKLSNHTYAGVQLIAGQVEPSAASTTLANGGTTPYFRTLLLHDQKQEQVSLLTPAVPFAPKQQIKLHTAEQDQPGQLTQLLMSSGSICHYAYRNT